MHKLDITEPVFYDVEIFPELFLIGIKYHGKHTFYIESPQFPINDSFENMHFNNTTMVQNMHGGFINLNPVGFNNHNYDDAMLEKFFSIQGNKQPAGVCEDLFNLSQRIVSGERIFAKTGWTSLDTVEQMPVGFSLKKWESMSGASILESSIPWDYRGEWTQAMVEDLIKYNAQDLDATEALFNERKAYFEGKELLANEYGWPGCAKFSNGTIVANYMMADVYDDRHGFDNDPRETKMPELSPHTFPEMRQFFETVFRDNPKLVRKQITDKDTTTEYSWEEGGMIHTIGQGGYHAATGTYNKLTKTGKPRKRPLKQYARIDVTDLEQWDVTSMFPNIMARDNLLLDATPKLKTLISERIKNKASGSPLAYPQKIIINSIYGLLRFPTSKLFRPEAGIAVNVAGMIAIYHLFKELEPFATVYQINTDGILFSWNDKPADGGQSIREEFKARFQLDLETSTFDRVIQKDVNNYIAIKGDHLKLKGGDVAQGGANYDATKLTKPRIVQVGLVQCLLNPSLSSLDAVKGGELSDYTFTLASTKSKTQTGFTVDSAGNVLDNKVNRVVASDSGTPLFKQKVDAAPAKFPGAPEKMAIKNMELSGDPVVDYTYYAQLVEDKLSQWR